MNQRISMKVLSFISGRSSYVQKEENKGVLIEYCSSQPNNQINNVVKIGNGNNWEYIKRGFSIHVDFFYYT